MSINPVHLPIDFDPEKIQGGSGGLAGLMDKLGHAAGMSTAADLALGQQFLSLLESEIGGMSAGGVGAAGMGYGDLMDKGMMTKFFHALQEIAQSETRQTQQPGQAAQIADTAKADVKIAATNAPEGVAKPIEAESPAVPEAAIRPEPVVASTKTASKAAFQGAQAYGGQALKSLAGFLAARFESGSDPGAVGFDRVGGTSYGAFQIASKPGSMDRFLDFLDENAPGIAEKLRAAGPANTGSSEGAMPDVWRELAEQDPDGFFTLQHDFIKESHLKPAAKWISEQTGVDILSRNPALSEVLFSTAVQHGPSGSAAIFARAVEKAMGETGLDFDKTLIKEVYKSRANQFGSSTAEVREAVKSRLSREEGLALSLLGAGPLLDASV